MKWYVNLVKFFVRKYFESRFKIEVTYNDFDPKREDAYVLIGNHPCLMDGIYSSPYLKKPPKPVISATMFVNSMMKFLLTKVYPSISKRKGQNDIHTVRKMIESVKNDRGVLLFPEGNSSYYGQQSPIPYSTVKLLKKLKKDVVIVKVNGAYLSAPRWGSKRTRNGLIEVNFYRLYKAEELKDLELDEIYERLTEEIKFNDFDWNREKKYLYKPKQRAVGLERFIYLCPKCNNIQTISTKKNSIYCSHCGEIAHFNEYTLLEGLDFDNLVEWGQLQHEALPRLSKKSLYTDGVLYNIDTIKYKEIKRGHVDCELIKDKLHVQHRLKEYTFELSKMIGLTLTFKDEVSFDYEDETYFIKMTDPMLFYEVMKYKMEAMK